MKRLAKLLTVIVSVWMLTSMFVNANDTLYTSIEEATIQLHEVITDYEVFSCSDVIHLEEGVTAVICYTKDSSVSLYVDRNIGTATSEIHSLDENGIIIDTVVKTYDISEKNEAVISPQVIRNNAESWWGFEFYYNTDSAYGDVYWRLYNPLDEAMPKHFFFAELGTSTQTYAEEFMMAVNEMQVKEEGIDFGAGMSIPSIFLSFGKATSLGEIIAALAEAGISSVSPDALMKIYEAKGNAIEFYDLLK